MLTVNPYAEHVTARLLDFFGDGTLWQRRLWSVGICLVLREIIEAAEALRAGVLSDAALTHLCDDALRLAKPDPAFRAHMGTLGAQLREQHKSPGPGGHRTSVIEEILSQAEPAYLETWAKVVEGSDRPKPERAARAIGAHLLDRGFHPNHLHRTLTYYLKHDPQPKTLGEIVAEFGNQLAAGATTYEVLVPLEELPKTRTRVNPSDWRDSTWVANWVRANTGRGAPRQYGGIVFRVEALDPNAAVESIAERLGQLSARFFLGAGTGLRAAPDAWVLSERRSYPLRVSPRGVHVGALDRNGKIFDLSTGSEVDSALELASPLERGAPGPAVAGAWSAIESLLSAADDSDNVAAGDRMAAVVACSFPRAELTRLARVHEESGKDALSSEIGCAPTNREKAGILERALRNGGTITTRNASDLAAQTRILDLCKEPFKRLADIEGHARSSIRRLYRQRNLVLHGGKTAAVALRASLRTSGPLVGAGLDRIAHAWFVHQLPALKVAARARVQLDVLQTIDGELSGLLE